MISRRREKSNWVSWFESRFVGRKKLLTDVIGAFCPIANSRLHGFGQQMANFSITWDIALFARCTIGWHSLSKSFQNAGGWYLSHSLCTKDFKKPKFSHIDGRLAFVYATNRFKFMKWTAVNKIGEFRFLPFLVSKIIYYGTMCVIG